MSGAETREEILAVSARLFESRGIADTTMRAIAEGCSIKAASLYNHFASKDEIVAEVMNRSSALAVGLFGEVRSADLTPADRVEALMRATMLSFRAHPEASRMFFENPGYVASAPLLRTVRAEARAIDALWAQTINDAIGAGALRDDIDPGRLWLLLRNMMLATRRETDLARASNVTDDVVTILLHGVLAPAVRRSGKQ